jgi:thiamine pyrophosphate-dependent acetolactate synthase large subunit-like protein
VDRQVSQAENVPDIMRRAFTQVRNGRPRGARQFPGDVMAERTRPIRYARRRSCAADPIRKT